MRAVAVPAYFHPAVAAGDWAALARCAAGLRAVVFNVDSGPGTAVEPELAAVAGAVHRAGGTLLGYLDTRYGQRPVAEIRAEAARYLSWYPVTGFFLDRAATAAQLLPWYAAVALPGPVVLNPGTYPAPGYADLADGLVVFEGPASAHQKIVVPQWVRAHPPDLFWHLVYATPPRQLGRTLRRIAASHAGTGYVTPRDGANPWDGLPPYLDRQMREWAGCAPVPAPA